MHAPEMSFRISRNHSLQRIAADQLKAAAGISCRDEISFLPALRLRTELSDIRQGSLPYTFAAFDATLRNKTPVHRLERVQRAGKVLIKPQQPLDLLRLKADISVNEQQVRGSRSVQKRGNQRATRPRD